MAARAHLRRKFLSAKVAVSEANHSAARLALGVPGGLSASGTAAAGLVANLFEVQWE